MRLLVILNSGVKLRKKFEIKWCINDFYEKSVEKSEEVRRQLDSCGLTCVDRIMNVSYFAERDAAAEWAVISGASWLWTEAMPEANWPAEATVMVNWKW